MAEKSAKGRKTRSAGRFGCRYGRKARMLVADIEENMRQATKRTVFSWFATLVVLSMIAAGCTPALESMGRNLRQVSS